MLTHKQIWTAIDRLAESAGYSTSGLAKKAGLDPTSFNKSKRFSPEEKPRWPSTESIAKILAVTGSAFSDFVSLIDEGTPPLQENIPLLHSRKPDKKTKERFSLPSFKNYNDPDLYAIELDDDSFLPLYRKGTILLISPQSSITKGDRIIVKPEGKPLVAGALFRQTGKRLDILSFHPDHEEYSFPADKISWTARILWATQ